MKKLSYDKMSHEVHTHKPAKPLASKLKNATLLTAGIFTGMVSFASCGGANNKPIRVASLTDAPALVSKESKTIPDMNKAKSPHIIQVEDKQAETIKLTRDEVLQSIETAKKYEIKIPELNCWDKSYAVFYSKYGQDFTLLITVGGGFAVYSDVRTINVRSTLELKGDATAVSPAFWACAFDEGEPGHKRIRLLEVPYKIVKNGKEEQRSLIVITNDGGVVLIAKDESSGKWKITGIIDYYPSEMLKDPKKDKPTLGVSFEKDPTTGEDIINISIINPTITKGIGMSFWSSDNGTSSAVPFEITSSTTVANAAMQK